MSEEINLDEVASQSMSETEPQTEIKEAVAEIVPEKEVSSTSNKVEKPITEQQKLSRRQQAAKEASDFRMSTEKERANWLREKQELQNQLKRFEPLTPYIEQLQKNAELKKQQDLANQYKNNPLATTEERMKQLVQEAIAPFKQQAEVQQTEQEINGHFNTIKQLAGTEENYKEVSPVMKMMLDNVIRDSPEDAERLARAPQLLYYAAKGYSDTQKGIQQTEINKQTEIENKNSKAEMAKFNGGVSRPNRTAKTPITTDTREAAKTNAYDFIKQLTGSSR